MPVLDGADPAAEVRDDLGPAGADGRHDDLDDDLDRADRRRATAGWIGGLGVGLVATLVLAVGLGPVAIAPGTVARVLGHHLVGWPASADWLPSQDAIVWQVRAPRVLLGAVVGMGLATSGVVLQAMVRNLLAEPYLLGVTSGASTGAAAAILFGVGSAAGAASLSASAFAGAVAASILVLLIARAGGRVTATRLLLAGVAVGYVLYAATSFLIFASDAPEGARSVLFWLLGSLAQARWAHLVVAAPVVALALVALVVRGRDLDALAIGDDTALALGVRPERFRVQLLAVVAAAVGATVAVSGGIGFVGLVVPHLARRLVGASHRRLLPVAGLLGASFLVWADVVARVAFQPRELPLGVVTAVVGAPFLLALVRRLDATSG